MKAHLGVVLEIFYYYLLLKISKNFTIKKLRNVSSTIGGVLIKVNSLKCLKKTEKKQSSRAEVKNLSLITTNY